jgi:hypothetical protein
MTTVSLMKAWRRLAAATVYLALLLAPAVAPAAGAGQAILVDRLVAIVGEQALTWRDVEAARLLGSIPPGGTAAEGVDRLITRELMLVEVERLAVSAPIAAAVDERLERARQRAGGADSLARALQVLGLTDDRAREWVADDLRIDVYVDQRFTAAAQPTDAEIAQEAARQAGRPPTADQLQDTRRRLVQARRTALITDWITGIRARTPVQIAGSP